MGERRNKQTKQKNDALYSSKEKSKHVQQAYYKHILSIYNKDAVCFPEPHIFVQTQAENGKPT